MMVDVSIKAPDVVDGNKGQQHGGGKQYDPLEVPIVHRITPVVWAM